MKLKIVGIIAVAFLSIACTNSKVRDITSSETESTEEIKGIKFYQGSWEQALALAKKENKLIFLDAYAVWCGPCKQLKRNVFPDEVLGEYFNEKFINIAMDMEKGIGRSLSKKYGLRAYPTLYFVNGDGNIVIQSVGYNNEVKLLELGKAAEAKKVIK